MKLSVRDKKILLMILGVAFLLIGWLFVYQPMMSKAEELALSSEPLRTRLAELLELSADREKYIEETERLNGVISDYAAQFPADVKEEDGILLAASMEQALGLDIDSLGLGTSEFIAALEGDDGSTASQEEQQTLSEQGNEATQEALDEIEGVDSEEDLDAALDAALAIDGNAALYRRQNTLTFTGTYQALKRTVEYLAQREDRTTLEAANLAFDSATGNLTGTLTVNQYSMTGLGKEYTAPNPGSVTTGTDNIFGTLESGAEEASEEETDTEE